MTVAILTCQFYPENPDLDNVSQKIWEAPDSPLSLCDLVASR